MGAAELLVNVGLYCGGDDMVGEMVVFGWDPLDLESRSGDCAQCQDL